MDIDKFIERNGAVLNGEIVVGWDTRQTYGQLVEIWHDSGDDPANITESNFLEYVKSNVVELVRNTVASEGEDGLARITSLVNDYGTEIRAEQKEKEN